MRTFNISIPDESLRNAVCDKIDNLNKPKGAMGQLEALAEQICMVQHTLTPELVHPCHLLFGADHGIEREGVSVSPREVTWQQMINFTHGGGGVNMLCRQHGFHLRLIDVGVDFDLSNHPRILNRKIRRGTDNFRYGPAMTTTEFDHAIDIGAEMVDYCRKEGCNILSIGEMGIGNTSPSSIWMHLLGNIPLEECIGAGAGLNAAGVQHKLNVLCEAVKLFKKGERGGERSHPVATEDSTILSSLSQDLSLLSYFGGFEMVAAVGAMLRADTCRWFHHVGMYVGSHSPQSCRTPFCRLCPLWRREWSSSSVVADGCPSVVGSRHASRRRNRCVGSLPTGGHCSKND